MNTTRTLTEYRVLSKREGNAVTDKRFFSRKAALDRIGRLTSPEPWRHYGTLKQRLREPDDFECCSGDRYFECGCGGETVREHAAAERKAYPPIEYVHVQKRTVTRSAWEPVEADTGVVPGAVQTLTRGRR